MKLKLAGNLQVGDLLPVSGTGGHEDVLNHVSTGEGQAPGPLKSVRQKYLCFYMKIPVFQITCLSLTLGWIGGTAIGPGSKM
jgi:hypothetical protein